MIKAPHAFRIMEIAIARAQVAVFLRLGPNLLSSDRTFELERRMGAGAYSCGEETAMLESLEGRPCLVCFKPPLPAIAGLFCRPTVINNAMSFASILHEVVRQRVIAASAPPVALAPAAGLRSSPHHCRPGARRAPRPARVPVQYGAQSLTLCPEWHDPLS